MKLILSSVIIDFATARPGNAELSRDGLLITKVFKKDHAGMKRNVLYEIEKNVLQRLEANKLECSKKRRHFPKLHHTNDQEKWMKMTYMGSTLRTDRKQFHDHPFICVKNPVDHFAFQEQVNCIIDTLRAANVRHLDLQCGDPARESGLKEFNVAYNAEGTVSLIDFELSTMDEQPDQWAQRCCYYQKDFCSFEQYLHRLNITFQQVVYPELRSKECGRMSPPSDYNPWQKSENQALSSLFLSMGQAPPTDVQAAAKKERQKADPFAMPAIDFPMQSSPDHADAIAAFHRRSVDAAQRLELRKKNGNPKHTTTLRRVDAVPHSTGKKGLTGRHAKLHEAVATKTVKAETKKVQPTSHVETTRPIPIYHKQPDHSFKTKPYRLELLAPWEKKRRAGIAKAKYVKAKTKSLAAAHGDTDTVSLKKRVHQAVKKQRQKILGKVDGHLYKPVMPEISLIKKKTKALKKVTKKADHKHKIQSVQLSEGEELIEDN